MEFEIVLRVENWAVLAQKLLQYLMAMKVTSVTLIQMTVPSLSYWVTSTLWLEEGHDG